MGEGGRGPGPAAEAPAGGVGEAPPTWRRVGGPEHAEEPGPVGHGVRSVRSAPPRVATRGGGR